MGSVKDLKIVEQALENKMVVEGAGAASLAAALNQSREERGKSYDV